MFPYLKKISDFLSDCETVRNEISLKKSGEHQFVTLYNPRRSDKHFTCNQRCESCKNMPSVVTQLIRNVDEANWGGDTSNGINSVAYSEIRAWCQSICVALYEVLKPLENMDLVIGFEYYLETRKGFGKDKKNHYRVDVMIGGYGIRFGKPEGRLLVMEQKQYEVVHWKKPGRELTWFYNNIRKTVESPCRQVKFYCDNISESLSNSSLNPYSVYPCVFMHNLKKENIFVGSYEDLDLDSADGVVFDNGVIYKGRPVEVFIKGEDEQDRYRALRDHISEIFDYTGTDQKAITVFRELKKGYPKFTQENLGDILVCEDEDIESRFKSILRPDQFFAMYGYGEDNYGLDNYLKNHIDYFSFFRDQENREYWGPSKFGVIDVIEGGPGSGKTVLAMLILRYCLSRGMSVLYTFSGTAPVNRIFGYLAELLSEQTQTDTGGKRNTFVESVNRIPYSELKKFEIFRSYKDKHRFDIVGLSDVPKQPDYDVYIIDDAHIDKERYVQSKPNEKNVNIIRNLEKKKKLIFMLYDKHQRIAEPIKYSDGSKENEYFSLIEEIASENPGGKAFRNRNSFRLWSMYRCNSNEGYLTWVEKVLGIVSYDKKKDFELFDFDVKILDDAGIKKLASAIHQDDDVLVMSEAISHDDLTRVLGRNAVIYSGENGMMKPLDENGAINVGRAIKIRGIEAEKAIVIIDDRIRFEDGRVVGDTNLKNRYRILLTRGLKECYLYVVDIELREFIKKSLK